MKITVSGGVFVLVTIVFVVLKLTGLIAWSWWWVFSPLLILAGIYAVILAFTLLTVLIVMLGVIIAAIVGVRK